MMGKVIDSRALSTPRLLLPPLERSHTPALAAVYSDPEVACYIGGERLTDESIPVQVADFADEWERRGYGQSAVVLRESGKFVGRIGLHYWPAWDEVELGYDPGAVRRRGVDSPPRGRRRGWIGQPRCRASITSLPTSTRTTSPRSGSPRSSGSALTGTTPRPVVSRPSSTGSICEADRSRWGPSALVVVGRSRSIAADSGGRFP